MSSHNTLAPFLLCLYVTSASCQLSMASMLEKPACSNPKDKPPHPENKSMNFSFLSLAIFLCFHLSHLAYLLRYIKN